MHTISANAADPFLPCINRLMARGVAREAIRTRFVPGRIEILGKHTDYCGGRSVICAIDRGFYLAYAPRGDAEVLIDALDLGDAARFTIDPELRPTLGTWSNYPMTVARRLARNFGGELRGADVAFTSTLPPAAGMSSSSAFMIAIYLALDDVNGLHDRPAWAEAIRSPADLAGYLGTIENGQSFRTLAGDRGVGTFGGSEDHTAILLGRPDVLGVYRFCPVVHERDVSLPAGYVLAVASSGVIAEKTGAVRERYNNASLRVRELIDLWNRHHEQGATTLADVVTSDARAADALRTLVAAHVPDPGTAAALRRRLDHFCEESESIIPAAVDALAKGDVPAFGRAVDRSQAFAEQWLQNQIEQTAFLARSAREVGAAAASAFGAGFGGSVWALLERSRSAQVLDAWRAAYAARFPAEAGAARFFTTRPVAGAG